MQNLVSELLKNSVKWSADTIIYVSVNLMSSRFNQFSMRSNTLGMTGEQGKY